MFQLGECIAQGHDQRDGVRDELIDFRNPETFWEFTIFDFAKLSSEQAEQIG